MSEPEGYELTGYSTSLEWPLSRIETIAERFRVTCWPRDLREDPESAADADTWSVIVQYRGGGKWSVDRSGFCLNRSGGWDVSLSASDRDDEWLNEHRFARDGAILRAGQATLTITVNGLTTMEAIARYRKDDDGQAQ